MPPGPGDSWGDVDTLSTLRPQRNPHHDERSRGYPRAPHHYGKGGFSYKKKERYVWRTLVTRRMSRNGTAAASDEFTAITLTLRKQEYGVWRKVSLTVPSE